MAVFNLASTVSSLASLPPLTRVLCSLLFLLSGALFLLRVFRTEDSVHWFQFSRQDSAIAFPALVIVPGVSFWYPWTLLTSAFCETTVTEFLISAISLPLAARYLERIWGPVELAKFVLVVVIGSNVIAWVVAMALFVVLRSEVTFYGTQYHGLEALQTAFLVALAQLIPDHQVQIWRSPIAFRVRDLPMAYVTFSNIVCVLGYTSPFILIQFGWLLSWVYLRFYKYNPDTNTRGDPSEAFTFVSWFPPFLQTPVTYISNFLHGIFLKLRVIPDFRYEHVAGNDADLEAGQNVDARAEAERRRAMALKALDQRIRVGSVSRSNSSVGAASSSKPTAAAAAVEPQSSSSSRNVEDVDAEWPSSDEDEGKERRQHQRDGDADGDADGDGDIGVSPTPRSKGKMQD